MYSAIVNPITGRKISIDSRIGKRILRNYLSVLKGGSGAAKKARAAEVEAAVEEVEEEPAWVAWRASVAEAKAKATAEAAVAGGVVVEDGEASKVRKSKSCPISQPIYCGTRDFRVRAGHMPGEGRKGGGNSLRGLNRCGETVQHCLKNVNLKPCVRKGTFPTPPGMIGPRQSLGEQCEGNLPIGKSLVWAQIEILDFFDKFLEGVQTHGEQDVHVANVLRDLGREAIEQIDAWMVEEEVGGLMQSSRLSVHPQWRSVVGYEDRLRRIESNTSPGGAAAVAGAGDLVVGGDILHLFKDIMDMARGPDLQRLPTHIDHIVLFNFWAIASISRDCSKKISKIMQKLLSLVIPDELTTPAGMPAWRVAEATNFCPPPIYGDPNKYLRQMDDWGTRSIYLNDAAAGGTSGHYHFYKDRKGTFQVHYRLWAPKPKKGKKRPWIAPLSFTPRTLSTGVVDDMLKLNDSNIPHKYVIKSMAMLFKFIDGLAKIDDSSRLYADDTRALYGIRFSPASIRMRISRALEAKARKSTKKKNAKQESEQKKRDSMIKTDTAQSDALASRMWRSDKADMRSLSPVELSHDVAERVAGRIASLKERDLEVISQADKDPDTVIEEPLQSGTTAAVAWNLEKSDTPVISRQDSTVTKADLEGEERTRMQERREQQPISGAAGSGAVYGSGIQQHAPKSAATQTLDRAQQLRNLRKLRKKLKKKKKGANESQVEDDIASLFERHPEMNELDKYLHRKGFDDWTKRHAIIDIINKLRERPQFRHASGDGFVDEVIGLYNIESASGGDSSPVDRTVRAYEELHS